MSTSTKRIIVLLIALALVVPFGLAGLSNLGGGSDPAGQQGASAPQSPTATTAPAPPAGMDQPTEAGAQATVDYMFAAYPYMLASGDIEPWGSISAPECAECVAFMESAAQLKQQGGWVTGGEITLNNPSVTIEQAAKNPTASHTATITSEFTEAPSQLVMGPQEEPVDNPGSTGTITLALKFDTEQKRWLITSITLDE